MNRTLLLLLAFSAAALLVACGDDDSKKNDDTAGADTAGGDTSVTDTAGSDTSGTDTAGADTGSGGTDTSVADTGAGADTTVADTTTGDVTASEADVFINELVITPTDQEAIELYNAGTAAVLLDGWTIEHTRATGSDAYALPTGITLTAGGYTSVLMSAISGSLVNRGALLTLKDSAGAVVDEVRYGTYNGAPAPIYAWSSARVANGVSTGNDAADFNMDPTPTLGAANDAPAVSLGSSNLVVNELLVDNTANKAGFVELYNKGTSDVDASNYVLVIGGDDYTFPAGTTIAAGAFFVIDQAAGAYPQYADTSAAELAYLFDANGVRLQDVNFLGATADGTASYVFYPDGNVTAFTGDLTATGLAATTNVTKGATNAQ